MKLILFSLIASLVCSCISRESRRQGFSNSTLQMASLIDTISVFVDSTHIGISNSSKVILLSVILDDSIPKTFVSFYSKRNSIWELRYSFADDYWHPSDILNAEVEDFNNDGKGDFKYSKGTGARGGNSIDNLFIYDRKGDTLSFVLNSNEYPNIRYNKETNSINACILTGGTETLFMRLDNNKLIPFASIYQYGNIVNVTEYDHKGGSTIILSDSSGKYPELSNFVNFKPLKSE